jgi:hypothetical protein
MSLLALQRDFAAWLRDGDGEDGSTAPGMRVYQNNYRVSLSACLEDAFAHTRAWIGEEAFARAVVEHICRVPPSSWTLDAYPRDFPDTLAFLYPDDVEVAELAWLELALGEVFVGPDAETLVRADAVNVDWDNAILHFIPTLDLRAVRSNAHALWSALDAERMPPEVELLGARHALLVWRHDMISRFRLVDEREEQALVLARSGLSFADLCAAAVAVAGEADGIALAGRWLGQWLADGLLTTDTGMTDALPPIQTR